MVKEGVVAAEGVGGADTCHWAVKEACRSLKGVASEEGGDVDVVAGSSRAVADRDGVVGLHSESRSNAHGGLCRPVYASSDDRRLPSAGGPRDVKEAAVGADSSNTCADGRIGDRGEQEMRRGDIIHLESK